MCEVVVQANFSHPEHTSKTQEPCRTGATLFRCAFAAANLILKSDMVQILDVWQFEVNFTAATVQQMSDAIIQ